MTIKCTTIGIEPSKTCYEICVLAYKCGALKTWKREEQKRSGELVGTESVIWMPPPAVRRR